jgi:lambda family phage portal protein
MSLWALSRLAARHNEFDGESFTVLSDRGRADKPIQMAVQVIDPERVATPAEFAGDPRVRLGIRTDGDGLVLGYYVQRTHPGDTRDVDLKFDWIPADRMLHVYEPWTAEQSRGLPWMTRAINRAKDAKDVDEAHILAAQIEACYAGFVKSSSTPGYMGATGAATGTTSGGRRTEDITPGTLRYLGPGEDVVFAAPVRPGNGFAPFMEWNYRRVAAAINWPYEMVVKNWAGLSFASSRVVLAGAKRATQVAQKMMAEQWLSRVWGRMVEESVIVGAIDVDPRDYLASPLVYQRHVWIAPRWDYALNPGEEVKADVEELSSNLALLEDAVGKRGYDLEDFIARKSRENRLLTDAGLTPVQTQTQVIAARDAQANSSQPSEVPA